MENEKDIVWCVEYGFSTGSLIHSQLFLTEKEADEFYKKMEQAPYVKKYRTHDIWGYKERKLKNDTGKAGFVANELSALLRRIDKDIESADYDHKPNGEEYVYVKYKNGFAINVCVTADSFEAITRDVLKKV